MVEQGPTSRGSSTSLDSQPTSDIYSLVPRENLDAYAFLFAIEVGLRELIIDRLKSLSGHQWYKRRLP